MRSHVLERLIPPLISFWLLKNADKRRSESAFIRVHPRSKPRFESAFIRVHPRSKPRFESAFIRVHPRPKPSQSSKAAAGMRVIWGLDEIFVRVAKY